MELYGVGNALLYFREKNKLSQIQLCEGICSIVTLCRIETGEREYDSLISDTLLGRLGKTANRFEFVLNEEDYRLYEMRNRIEGCKKNKVPEEAEKLLTEYSKIMPEDQPLHLQFLLFKKAMILKLKGSSEEEIKKLLHQAINITRPDFMEKSEKMKLFSFIEVKIIYELFLYEKYEEDKLIPLFRYMDQYYDAEEKERNMIPFLYKLVHIYEEKEKFYDVIKICDKAIDIICSGRGYLYMADFYFYKMKVEEKIYGMSEQWKNRRKELMEECNNLFYMYMTEENQEKMDQVAAFCEEKFQCQIIKPEI